MSTNWNDAVREVTSKSLEELCFLIPGADEASFEGEPVAAAAYVVFEGPTTGSVLIQMRGGLLQEIATNMLGDDAGEAARRDALGEVANIICGHIVPVIWGSEAVFSLRRPEFPADLGESLRGRAPFATGSVAFDSGVADVTLFVD
jgi:hypothetical protein